MGRQVSLTSIVLFGFTGIDTHIFGTLHWIKTTQVYIPDFRHLDLVFPGRGHGFEPSCQDCTLLYTITGYTVLYTGLSTLYCTLYSETCIVLKTLYCTLYWIHCIVLFTEYFVLHTAQNILYCNLWNVNCIVHFVFYSK